MTTPLEIPPYDPEKDDPEILFLRPPNNEEGAVALAGILKTHLGDSMRIGVYLLYAKQAASTAEIIENTTCIRAYQSDAVEEMGTRWNAVDRLDRYTFDCVSIAVAAEKQKRDGQMRDPIYPRRVWLLTGADPIKANAQQGGYTVGQNVYKASGEWGSQQPKLPKEITAQRKKPTQQWYQLPYSLSPQHHL